MSKKRRKDKQKSAFGKDLFSVFPSLPLALPATDLLNKDPLNDVYVKFSYLIDTKLIA